MVPWVLKDTVNLGKSEFVVSGDCTRCGLCIDACEDSALDFHIRAVAFIARGEAMGSPSVRTATMAFGMGTLSHALQISRDVRRP